MQVLRLHSENPNHSYETIVTCNTLLEAAKVIIAKNDIDIIIMGTKGMTGSRAVVFGTKIIRIKENEKECPVLAIPEDVRFSPPKEIAFPTDYKNPFKR